MSNENKEKAMLADDLSQYIREKHNQDECVGFSDGYKSALKKLKLMDVSSDVSNLPDDDTIEFLYNSGAHSPFYDDILEEVGQSSRHFINGMKSMRNILIAAK